MVLGWPTGSKTSLEMARLDDEDLERERAKTAVEAAVAGRSDPLGENPAAAASDGPMRSLWRRLVGRFRGR